jgi:hypothetical protein
MLDKVISGGRTGAERAAWRAAQNFGIATGGSMPRGFSVDDSLHPEFADRYGATELPTDVESTGLEPNVRDSDGTLWLGDTTTEGAQATVGACQRLGKPCLPVYPGASFEPAHVATWIAQHQIRMLNVAGNRDADEPGIGERVERFLGAVLQQLGHQRV